MTYTVYEYGIKRIVAGEEYLLDQLRERHRYWNALVQIEREFRLELDQLYDLIYDACDGDADRAAVHRGSTERRREGVCHVGARALPDSHG